MKNLKLIFLMLLGSTSHALESKLYRGVDFRSTCAKAASIEENNGFKFITLKINKDSQPEVIVYKDKINIGSVIYTCKNKKWDLSVSEIYKTDIEATNRMASLKKESIHLHGKPTFSPEDIGLLERVTIFFNNDQNDRLKTFAWKLSDRDIFLSKRKFLSEWEVFYFISTPSYIIQCNGNVCNETNTRL